MKRKAFTLFELVMVIVVLGIIASIGSDIISSMYQNYLRTRAINRLEAQTEIVLEQITKRLSHRIKRSTGVYRATVAAPSVVPLRNANSNDRILVWIGASEESRLGGWVGAPTNRFVPGWSGFIDLNSTNTDRAAQTIETPGSRLNFAGNIINALTNGDVTMANGRAAIMMKTPPVDDADISRYWTNVNSDYTTIVTSGTNTNFALPATDRLADYTGNGQRDIYEQYYLSHSAYAIVPSAVDAVTGDFTLTLRYNFQPWNGETVANAVATPPAAGSSATLAEHVSTFRFVQTDSSIRIKLCINDANQSADFGFSACKETVVF